MVFRVNKKVINTTTSARLTSVAMAASASLMVGATIFGTSVSSATVTTPSARIETPQENVSVSETAKTSASNNKTVPCGILTPGSTSVFDLSEAATETRASWVASDGFRSVPMRNKDTLFFNGDTLYGTKKDGEFTGGLFARNSVLQFRNGCFLAAPPIKSAHGFLYDPGTNPRKDFYWPTAGYHGKPYLYQFASKMHTKTGESVFDFHQTGTTLFTIQYKPKTKNPIRVRNRTPIEPVQFPAPDQPLSWGATVVNDDEYVYVYALHWNKEPLTPRTMYVARVPISWANTRMEDTSGWEFYTTKGWKKAPEGKQLRFEDLKPISGPIFGATATVSASPNGGYYAVTRPLEFMDKRIVVYRAKTPVGPFTIAAEYPLISEEGFSYYNAQAHPSMPAPEGQVWVSVDQQKISNDLEDQVAHTRPLWQLIPTP